MTATDEGRNLAPSGVGGVVTALPALGQVKLLADRQTHEKYWGCLTALARRGKVPDVTLSHLAVRVLQFLLGQRPGYFAHQKVIANAAETNLTSVRKALFELRDAGFVSWNLIPPHHPLPTGKYTRTNVSQYFVEADALLRALGGDEAGGPPRTVAPTHPNSSAPTGTDLKFEQDPPLTPSGRLKRPPDRYSGKGEIKFLRFPGARPAPGQPHAVERVRRADQGESRTLPPELEKVLSAWRTLDLGEPDDRSRRALSNRHAEGATSDELATAVEGARHDEWLRQGRAKSPFAVVFASLASVKRFADVGRDYARKTEAAARLRAAERRAARAQFDDVAALSPAENAELAALALRTVAYPGPAIRSNYSRMPTGNFSPPLANSPDIIARSRGIPCTKAAAEIQVGRSTMAMVEHSNSQVTEPRALTEQERTLIRWMLDHAAVGAAEFLEHLERARVISGCDCGCASINLQVEGHPLPTGGMRIIGDFLYGDESSLCGAFVFESHGVLAGLEVYGLAVDAPTILPDPHQLRPFETGEHVAGNSAHLKS